MVTVGLLYGPHGTHLASWILCDSSIFDLLPSSAEGEPSLLPALSSFLLAWQNLVPHLGEQADDNPDASDERFA